MTHQEISLKGQEIAYELNWDGHLIFKVLLEALTDANFHTLRKQLESVSIEFNTNFPEENKIKRELSESGLLGYKLFLEDLTDGNYHDLRNKISELLIAEIEKRNKREFKK